MLLESIMPALTSSEGAAQAYAAGLRAHGCPVPQSAPWGLGSDLGLPQDANVRSHGDPKHQLDIGRGGSDQLHKSSSMTDNPRPARPTASADVSPSNYVHKAVPVARRDIDGITRAVRSRASRLPIGFTAAPTRHQRRTTLPRHSCHHGVTWNEDQQAWAARIWTGGRSRTVGFFKHEVEAACHASHAAVESLRENGPAPLAYSGVSWSSATGQWTGCLSLTHTHEPVWLGVFECAAQVLMAYTAAFSIGRVPASQRSIRKRRKSSERYRRSLTGQPSKPSQQSRFRGVSVSDSSSRWRAQVWDGQRVLYLGTFNTEEAAARAYDLAVVKLRGSKAKTNFPVAAAAQSAQDLPEGCCPPSSCPCSPAGNAGFGSPGHSISSAPGHPGSTVQVLHSQRQSSRFKGVSWSERSGKWRAQIWSNSKVQHLGFYDTEVKAARAFDQAAAQIRGPRAILNFHALDDSTFCKSESAQSPGEQSLPGREICKRPIMEHGTHGRHQAVKLPKSAARDRIESCPIACPHAVLDDKAVADLLLQLMD